MRHTNTLNLTWFLLFLPVFGMTQVRFTAETDARQVVLGSSFTVEFTLNKAGGSSFNPPGFQGFDILSGPNESRSVSITNGQRIQCFTLSYTLLPQKTGKFTIGAADVQIDGKILSTAPFQVEVLKRNDSSATTKEELDKELSENIFIKSILDKESYKPGEQIILDYKLYSPKIIDYYRECEESDYDGHEIKKYTASQEQEVIDGVQYSTKVIKKVALFPQKPGVINIGSWAINIYTIQDTALQRRYFSIPRMTVFSVYSDPIEIKVDPLPEPVPSSFTGAVGKYDMSTSINSNQLITNDTIILKMYITGDGDINQIKPPRLNFPDKFKVIDPKLVNESSYEENGILKGKKEFEYQVIPLIHGEYELMATFNYYDTERLKYITLNADRFPITVKKR